MKKKRLGEVLRERGQLSAADLSRVLEEQQQDRLKHLGELLLQRGLVTKPELASALLEVFQVPYIDCTALKISPELLKVVPPPIARRCRVLPVAMEGAELVVAMAEPQNLQLLAELRFKTGKPISPRLAFGGELEAAIAKHYGPETHDADKQEVDRAPVREDRPLEFISSTDQKRNVEAMREMQAELNQKSKTTPAVLVVASMIRDAMSKKASDIHVEPQSADMAIRFRVDGMLREYQRVSRHLQNTVTSRIKILSDMDISERRAPQDGRFLVKVGDRRVDLRVSTLPTQYGEKVVLRLLEATAPRESFSTLGIPAAMEEKLKSMLALPQGMILVTGPTGSGKSTTLYSALTYVRKPSINIITVEDPVEYAVPGLNQVQVNTKAGVTFASCLRSILRQDPNIIMVGEIRDRETAEIALKAAQTGHLVVSTLHTNDSVSAVTRLLDLGVPAFQIASSMTGILAQRLIRKLCRCRKTVPPRAEFISRLQAVGTLNLPVTQSVPAGCEECDLTGYKGRIGIYEMLVVDEVIRAAIRAGQSGEELRGLARRNGVRLMHEQALDQVCAGSTTIEEVERVVPIEHASRARCPVCQRDVGGEFLFCPYCGAQTRAGSEESAGEYEMAERHVVNQ